MKARAQLDERGLGVAFGYEHGAGGPGGVRSQERRSERGGDPTELIGGGAGGGGVAGGEHDLDVGAEQARPRDRVLGFAEGAADHRVGGVEPSLGESQQREAGLGVPAVLAGALVRGLGAVEVADEAEEVTLDRACAAEGGGVDGCGEPIAGVSGFDERFGPRPEQFQDLGAVQEAVAAVEHELLLGVAPADERLGPRSAPAEVEQLRARVDHRAVRVTGRER